MQTAKTCEKTSAESCKHFFWNGSGIANGTRGRGVCCEKLSIVAQKEERAIVQNGATTKARGVFQSTVKNLAQQKNHSEKSDNSKSANQIVKPENSDMKITLLQRPNPQDATQGRSKKRVRSARRIPTPPRKVPKELEDLDRMTSADFRHDTAARLDVMRNRQKDQEHMYFFQNVIHHQRHLIKDRTILVLCCGTGTLALMAARMGAKRVYAVDYSKMLSVQTAGCAGMERLGVPTRTSLSTPPDDRDQFRCRMRVDALQARELLAVRGETVIRGAGNNQHQQQHHLHHSSSSSNKQQHSHHQQQRMTTPSTHNSGGGGGGGGGAAAGGDHQHHHHQHQLGNNSSSNNNNSISSNVARGGIEATTLKYGNTNSGSGSGCYKGDCGNSSSGSSCSSLQSHSNDHHQHYQYQLQQQQTPRCPHHVPLPDSEYGQDRHLQIRSSYQQSEITRSYTKPPPNKTVRDVPEQISAGGCGVSSSSYRLTTLQAASSTYTPAGVSVSASSSSSKSKPNAITKFFSRISSPKSPPSCTMTSVATASPASSVSMSSSASSLASSACVSTSSSASSLAAAPTLPVSNASLLKSTACGYGTNPSGIYAGLGTGTSGNCSPERIPTPPLSVSVPIGAGQQPLRSSSSGSSSSTASLAAVETTTTTATTQSSFAAGATGDLPLTTMSRNNSNSSMMSYHCSCNSRNCSHCAANS
ncbi:platelet binding protein GspB isoform X2 [Drosophila sechellia]|uniref:platelet binding protein GspB isoform X2 n=1 Tax=Drosophila sechellia TaxID=7238 RepID=UPI0013DDF720|nr:platelet binding protein GspB isoform X2 [Drosophila sechellia]